MCSWVWFKEPWNVLEGGSRVPTPLASGSVWQEPARRTMCRERVTLHKLMSVLADVCYRVLVACLVREDGLALLGLR